MQDTKETRHSTAGHGHKIVHTHTYTHTHTHIHAHTYIYTLTHTHTHTVMYKCEIDVRTELRKNSAYFKHVCEQRNVLREGFPRKKVLSLRKIIRHLIDKEDVKYKEANIEYKIRKSIFE